MVFGVGVMVCVGGSRNAVTDGTQSVAHLDGELGELLDGELARVADVDGSDGLLLVHEPDEAIDQIVDVWEERDEGVGGRG